MNKIKIKLKTEYLPKSGKPVTKKMFQILVFQRWKIEIKQLLVLQIMLMDLKI